MMLVLAAARSTSAKNACRAVGPAQGGRHLTGKGTQWPSVFKNLASRCFHYCCSVVVVVRVSNHHLQPFVILTFFLVKQRSRSEILSLGPTCKHYIFLQLAPTR